MNELLLKLLCQFPESPQCMLLDEAQAPSLGGWGPGCGHPLMPPMCSVLPACHLALIVWIGHVSLPPHSAHWHLVLRTTLLSRTHW